MASSSISVSSPVHRQDALDALKDGESKIELPGGAKILKIRKSLIPLTVTMVIGVGLEDEVALSNVLPTIRAKALEIMSGSGHTRFLRISLRSI